VFTIPADGLFVLAATLCCDNEFLGGGLGTYRLSLTSLLVIGSISGRVVDALTGTPLPSTVRNGALICVQVFAGQGAEPFFDTVGHRDLFCVLKGFTGGFSVLAEDEVKALRQQVDERSMIPPTQQGLQKHASKKVR
jgi:hypothetical protein